MSADAAVRGDRRPAVLEDLYVGCAEVDHGLDGQNHARFEARSLASRAEIRELRVFVHALTDAVSDKLANDAVTLFFAHDLNGV